MTKVFSWFRRLFTSFGEEVTAYTKPEQLVERARCQDQVAIAHICEVRKNAEGGDPLAKKTLAEIIAYAKTNPPTVNQTAPQFNGDAEFKALRQACFSGDPEQAAPSLLKVGAENPNRAIVTVANTCDARELAAQICQSLSNDENFTQAFCNPALAMTVMKKMKHGEQHALLLGFILGIATRIQMVRNPAVPISVFSKQVAWELGANATKS